jgi:hypothetical protein
LQKFIGFFPSPRGLDLPIDFIFNFFDFLVESIKTAIESLATSMPMKVWSV